MIAHCSKCGAEAGSLAEALGPVIWLRVHWAESHGVDLLPADDPMVGYANSEGGCGYLVARGRRCGRSVVGVVQAPNGGRRYACGVHVRRSEAFPPVRAGEATPHTEFRGTELGARRQPGMPVARFSEAVS